MNNVKYKKIHFEYQLQFNYNCTCDYCKNENIYTQNIIKTKDEYVLENKEEIALEEAKKNSIINSLKLDTLKSFNEILNLANEKNYSYLKYSKCKKCNKSYKYSFRNYKNTKLFFSIALYLLIVFVFLILNIFLKNTMLEFFNYKDSFFTSIFFFPLISLIICFICFLYDFIKLKKEEKEINKSIINYPIIDKETKENIIILVNEK